MKAMEKIKLSKERVNLIADLKNGSLKGLAKIKASKRVIEIVVLLGGVGSTANPDAAINPVYQSVLDGAPITRELIEQVEAEGQKDPEHPQLRPAVRIIVEQCQRMAA
ncbi:MAG: hypothetical protein RLY58_1302 [Pseudomonadota bacterium]|jgi:hypothetical protein